MKKFILGDNWLYYKIYTGAKTADILISIVILPTVEKLFTNQLISKWSFLRYHDPKYHIRVRFFLPDTKNIGSVIIIIKEILKLPFDERLIWKVQADIYNREIERYGKIL